MLTDTRAGDAELRRHAAVPVERQAMLRGLLRGVDDALLEDRADHPLCELYRCRRMLPHDRQVVAQVLEPLALLVIDGHALTRQRGEVGFHRSHTDSCLVPAAFQLTCHKAVGGIDAVIVPPSSLGLVARLLQRALDRLGLGLMGGHHLLQGLERRVHPRGLPDVEPRGGHRLVDAERP